jgi:protein phosphatase
MAAMEKITVNAAAISHIGNIRTNNEDNFFLDGQMMAQYEVNQGCCVQTKREDCFHLFAICDGMGGLEGGERASWIGVSGLQELYHSIEDDHFQNEVRQYAMKATDAVLEDAAKNGKDQKEGTTLALLYLHDETAYAANIGDSRVYLLRKGCLNQITRDHSQVFQMMLKGELTREQMRKHPRANAISHFMGMPRDRINESYIYFVKFDLAEGDRFLICSDGLSDLISFERIEEMLSTGDGPMRTAENLVLEALELGGKDNTTVLVIDVTGTHLKDKPVDELPGMDLEEENSPTAN